MGTKNKAVTAYLPADIEALLTKYCLAHGLSRQGKKSGKEKPALGTGIIEVLRTFFGSETASRPAAPSLNKRDVQKIVAKSVPANLTTEDWVQAEIQKAIAALKEELTGETPVVVEEVKEPEVSEESKPAEVEKTEAAGSELLLSQADLARRLGSNSSTLSRHQKKSSEHFAEWSKEKDPEKLAWKFKGLKENSKVKIFEPIS